MSVKWAYFTIAAFACSVLFTGLAIYDTIYGNTITAMLDVGCAAANVVAIYFVQCCVPEIEQRKKERAELLEMP